MAKSLINTKESDFKKSILELLEQRGRDKTICPSEVLPLELKKDKTMMELVRASAKFLALEDKINITQGGKPVDPNNFKGPIRLRLK